MNIRFMLTDGEQIHYANTDLVTTSEEHEPIYRRVMSRVVRPTTLCEKPTQDMKRIFISDKQAKQLNDCETCQSKSFEE